MKVVVGSKTFSKIEATRRAFACLMPEYSSRIEVVGCAVPSGVSAMPLTNGELREGAINRVVAAQMAHPGADYYVGIEGGFATEFEQTFCTAWYAILYRGRYSVGRTLSFLVPPEIVAAVQAGKELGEVVESLSRGVSRRGDQGLIGLLTNGQYTRVEFDTQGIIAALGPLQWEGKSITPETGAALA